MKKTVRTCIIFALVLALSSTCLLCFATTVSTTEFGTFTYYCNNSGGLLCGNTRITKTSITTYLETRGSLVYYNTGEEIISDYDGDYNETSTMVRFSRDNHVGKLKAFFTHEAIGNTSIARYTSGILN